MAIDCKGKTSLSLIGGVLFTILASGAQANPTDFPVPSEPSSEEDILTAELIESLILDGSISVDPATGRLRLKKPILEILKGRRKTTPPPKTNDEGSRTTGRCSGREK